ncbi:hypothetical protein [Phenylobacterium sp.]|uniref:hypothetical protein n=1 Tax=Phenylobacterium sp. TaxID=1871053 RepID=UPI0028115E6B|nr:hypothetical protein [Phenylobacterium sp.]
MADRRIEVVNRRAVVTVSGAALIAPMVQRKVEEVAAPDRAAAEAAAAKAQALYDDMLEIQAVGDDAAAIAARAAKAANGSDFEDKEEVTQNLLFLQSGAGAESRSVRDKLRDFVSVLDYGAVGDGKAPEDGFILAGTSRLDSETANFTAADVGKKISVAGAGPGGSLLTTTIASLVSSGSVNLADAASTNALGRAFAYGTDDTAAIQAAIEAHSNIYFPGAQSGRRYMFTHLEKPMRSRWFGDGPYSSVLRQFGDVTATTPAVTLTGYLPLNIAQGGHIWDDIGIEFKSNRCIEVISASASIMRSQNFRIMHLDADNHLVKPYVVSDDTVAFYLDGVTSPHSTIYLASHRNIEVRGCGTAVKATGPVNEQYFHGWFLDNRIGFDLEGVSTWNVETAFESGVDDAKKYRLAGDIANLRGFGRCEIPVAEASPGVPLSSTEHYMVEFVGAVNAANVILREEPILITQDGNGWPGRKYMGTLPDGVLFDIPLGVGADLYRAQLGKSTNTVFFGVPLHLGGNGRGDGKITFGRDQDSAGEGVIENDGSFLALDHPNGVRVAQQQGGVGYQKPFFIGGYGLWVDGSGRLRIMAGFPSSDTDGTVVGTQS